jgi:hypothetical protein
MLILVSGATTTLKKWDDPRFGVLVVPNANNNPESLPLRPGAWAMDNGAFSGLDKLAFYNMLERHYTIPGCLWVTAPDVLGDAGATLARWPFWSRVIRGVGFPPALVAQDGMTADRVPWEELGGLFIGGSTAWKLSREAEGLVAVANARGIPTHMGRVNDRGRLRTAMRWGVQSIDGTSRSMFPEVQFARDQRWMDEWHRQPEFQL